MWIIIKFTLRNIKENKFRTFLILLSITLSSALLFATLSISDTVVEMYLKRMQKYYGSADIMIYPGQDSPANFIRMNKAEGLTEQYEYIVGQFEAGASYLHSYKEEINTNLQGYLLEELQVFNPINLEEKKNLQPFEGNKAIISRLDAEKYGLKLGTKMDLLIKGYKHRFTVVGIASSRGIFRPEASSNSLSVIVPREKLASFYGARGRVNTIYLKTREEIGTQAAIKELALQYPRYTVRQTITAEEVAEYSKSMTTMFMLMLPLVFFISIFIIYSSFKVITIERLPVIGTFRSIGATRKMTDLLLMGESICYSLLGGVLGSTLGLGILYFMMKLIANDPWSGRLDTRMVYNKYYLVIAFAGAVLLGVVSSIIPIVKVSKKPVKNIILNIVENKTRKKDRRLFFALFLMIVSLLIPRLIEHNGKTLIVDAACMLLSGIALVIMVPFLVDKLITMTTKVFSAIFGNEGLLAVKNLKDNKNIVNNISLLTIGIASLILINIVSHSIGIMVVDVFNKLDFDLWVWVSGTDRQTRQIISTIDGVQDALSLYEARNVRLSKIRGEIGTIYGADPKEYLDFNQYELVDDRGKTFTEFKEGRGIILTLVLKEKFKVEKGDYLILDTPRGHKKYKIISFMNSMMNNGNTALANERFLKQDMQLEYYGDTLIRADQNVGQVQSRIKERFARRGLVTYSVARMKEMNIQSNNQMFIMMKGFSMITMLIGIAGIFNNYVINFISRKRTLAIYRSVGMSRRQSIKMLLLEATAGGMIGGLVGIIGGILFLSMVGFISRAMFMPLTVHYTPQMFLNYLVSGIIISIVASISPTLKSSRFNIIEAIKYE